jgi:hypothetical protein
MEIPSVSLVRRQLESQPTVGMTGYKAIRQDCCMAIEDSSVRATPLRHRPPDGDVAGFSGLWRKWPALALEPMI